MNKIIHPVLAGIFSLLTLYITKIGKEKSYT